MYHTIPKQQFGPEPLIARVSSHELARWERLNIDPVYKH